MAHTSESFDGLKVRLIGLLEQGRATLDDIAEIITQHAMKFDATQLAELKSELSALEIGQKEIAQRIEHLYRKAIYDRTGIRTRLYFDEWVQRCENERQVAFIMADIDKFHDYNAAYGHLQGDIALTEIATQFNSAVDSSKDKAETVLVARYGGEEFCALITNYAKDENDMKRRLETARRAVEHTDIPLCEQIQPGDEGYRKRTITIAGGIRMADEPILSLVRRVDEALKTGKNRDQRNQSFLA